MKATAKPTGRTITLEMNEDDARVLKAVAYTNISVPEAVRRNTGTSEREVSRVLNELSTSLGSINVELPK